MFRYGYLVEDPVYGTNPIGRGAWLEAVGVGLAAIGLGISVGGALVVALVRVVVVGIVLAAVGLVLAVDQLVYDWNPNYAVGYNWHLRGFQR
jgi:hypothetical protein